ncbi:MAG: tRNA threonylcarbamoyladenosine biosynthesis protein TsaB [Gammaproteobacteria bacterium]|jgi:tRNA threonylcarbamoyladenosine biosynthesis protein TsaB
MNLLAIETSSDACSVALLCGTQIQTDHRIVPQQHGRLVLPMIDALMAQSELSVNQLDGVVFGRGPGSFTGVRIAVALTQGVALGADVGVIGISTINSIAQGVYRQHGDCSVAVSIDARMDEVYFAAYTLTDDGVMKPVTEEYLCPPESIPALPKDAHRSWAGSGAQRYSDLLSEQYAVPMESIRKDMWPDAYDLISLALPKVQSGELQAAEHAMPVYLRNKVADTTEERELAKQTKARLGSS